MRFLCFFLFVVSAYGAEMDAKVDASPLKVIMGVPAHFASSHRNIDGRRVYRLRDNQGEHRISVTYNRKKLRLGEFVAQDVEAQRSLSILMEFGGELNKPLCTKITYKDTSKTEEIVLTSWAEDGKDNGRIEVVAPHGAIYGRSGRLDIPIERPDMRGRPDCYGTLNAQGGGAVITQYPFRTADPDKGGFVKIFVDHFKLNHVSFFFGTEIYGSEYRSDYGSTDETGHLLFKL